jgi:hypothetical protein
MTSSELAPNTTCSVPECHQSPTNTANQCPSKSKLGSSAGLTGPSVEEHSSVRVKPPRRSAFLPARPSQKNIVTDFSLPDKTTKFCPTNPGQRAADDSFASFVSASRRDAPPARRSRFGDWRTRTVPPFVSPARPPRSALFCRSGASPGLRFAAFCTGGAAPGQRIALFRRPGAGPRLRFTAFCTGGAAPGQRIALFRRSGAGPRLRFTAFCTGGAAPGQRIALFRRPGAGPRLRFTAFCTGGAAPGQRFALFRRPGAGPRLRFTAFCTGGAAPGLRFALFRRPGAGPRLRFTAISSLPPSLRHSACVIPPSPA